MVLRQRGQCQFHIPPVVFDQQNVFDVSIFSLHGRLYFGAWGLARFNADISGDLRMDFALAW
jgi:hypothetical protein